MGSETVKGTNAIDELETVNIFVNAREWQIYILDSFIITKV